MFHREQKHISIKHIVRLDTLSEKENKRNPYPYNCIKRLDDNRSTNTIICKGHENKKIKCRVLGNSNAKKNSLTMLILHPISITWIHVSSFSHSYSVTLCFIIHFILIALHKRLFSVQ